MAIIRRFLVPLSVALAALALSARSQAASQAEIQVSSDNVVVGGESLVVAGTGFASCSGARVSVSLVFPTADDRGNRQPVSDAARLSTVAAPIDGSGNFQSSLAMPGAFPGAWRGYVVAEAHCVDVDAKQVLSRVYVSVPLRSRTAEQLGIPQQEGAVLVVPADDIRGYPIMVDDPVKDPYVKLAPFAAVGPDGQACGSAGANDRNSAGDIIIPLTPECARDGMVVGVKVLSTGQLLQTPVTVRNGLASGVRLVFPPPATASESPAPAPPSAGNAERALPSAQETNGTLLWLIGFTVACAASIGLVVVRRRLP